MKKIYSMLILFFLVACTTPEEEPHYGDGFGELKRDGYKTEINCFQILKKTAQGLAIVDAPTIIKEDASDYLPLSMLNTSLAYIFSLKVPAEYYTEDEYQISLRALKIDFKECGEAKEVTFFRFAEEDGIAEYRSYENKDNGKYIFLAQREMPSYDWYDVLNVCVNESGKFRLEGVVLDIKAVE